ncbi:basement membrane-specific heparan sulfate proteoglycan core protein-like isoform X2 [Hemiscyllium ocellatum]|uniref:basement membrane-specific heparan sulfate proteoglycan core protein-like isoform X2 n=1 Tax=Hemiscyllium ocellatum TaxID=170820 RepID=UPI00296650B2|nr:basement membrane-specific heparan sulfate proteoglycan core protein-like isoform X2 [Hemiscyllium ocellatum]
MISGTLFAVTLSLCVAFGADPPVLLQSPTLERVTEGHSVRLLCTVKNTPVTHTDVHWYREQPGRRREWILVHYSWNFVRWYSGYYTWNSMQWYFGFKKRFQSSRNSSSNSFILTIENVQPYDTGVYYCSVWRSISGEGSRLIVNSTSGPVLLQSPMVERVTEGHTAQLQCTMRNGTVAKTIVHWYRQEPGSHMKLFLTHDRNGYVRRGQGSTDRFQLSREPSSNSFILTITKVQPSDSGVYYCSVWGSVPGGGSQLVVNSTNVPVLLQSPILEHVTEGQTAQLQCTMRNAAVTLADVHWHREQPGNSTEWVLTYDVRNITQWSPGFAERFQSSRSLSNNSYILTITNTQPSDTGFYYCKVWGDISGNRTQLIVRDPIADPVLIQYPVVSKVAESETVEFQCAMYNASVIDTDVHWHYQRPGSNREWMISHFVNGTLTTAQGFHDRVLLSRNVSRNSYILSLVNVTLNDTAVYSCSVWSYIYGAGSQLIVTEESSHGIPQTSGPISIIGTILAFAVLICIVLLTFCLWKQNLCSSVKDSTQGSNTEQ